MPFFGPKQGRRPKWPFFLPQKGQFWAKNSVPWAWVASSRPPHAISQVLDSKKKSFAAYGSRKMGESGPPPPPPKMAIFCQKKRPNNANFGPKTVFFGLGWPFQGPPPYFAGARLKKTCVVGYGSRKMGDSPPPPPKRPFFAQKRPKNANFGPKPVFFGLGWPFQAPPPYFAGARLKKIMSCSIWEPENG